MTEITSHEREYFKAFFDNKDNPGLEKLMLYLGWRMKFLEFPNVEGAKVIRWQDGAGTWHDAFYVLELVTTAPQLIQV